MSRWALGLLWALAASTGLAGLAGLPGMALAQGALGLDRTLGQAGDLDVAPALEPLAATWLATSGPAGSARYLRLGPGDAERLAPGDLRLEPPGMAGTPVRAGDADAGAPAAALDAGISYADADQDGRLSAGDPLWLDAAPRGRLGPEDVRLLRGGSGAAGERGPEASREAPLHALPGAQVGLARAWWGAGLVLDLGGDGYPSALDLRLTGPMAGAQLAQHDPEAAPLLAVLPQARAGFADLDRDGARGPGEDLFLALRPGAVVAEGDLRLGPGGPGTRVARGEPAHGAAFVGLAWRFAFHDRDGDRRLGLDEEVLLDLAPLGARDPGDVRLAGPGGAGQGAGHAAGPLLALPRARVAYLPWEPGRPPGPLDPLYLEVDAWRPAPTAGDVRLGPAGAGTRVRPGAPDALPLVALEDALGRDLGRAWFGWLDRDGDGAWDRGREPLYLDVAGDGNASTGDLRLTLAPMSRVAPGDADAGMALHALARPQVAGLDRDGDGRAEPGAAVLLDLAADGAVGAGDVLLGRGAPGLDEPWPHALEAGYVADDDATGARLAAWPSWRLGFLPSGTVGPDGRFVLDAKAGLLLAPGLREGGAAPPGAVRLAGPALAFPAEATAPPGPPAAPPDRNATTPGPSGPGDGAGAPRAAPPAPPAPATVPAPASAPASTPAPAPAPAPASAALGAWVDVPPRAAAAPAPAGPPEAAHPASASPGPSAQAPVPAAREAPLPAAMAWAAWAGAAGLAAWAMHLRGRARP